MSGKKTTAAPEGLFKTDIHDEPNLLNEVTEEFFHTTSAQALYLQKRGKPDIQTAVTFLCTRVRTPNENDYKKLAHLMKFIQATNIFTIDIAGIGEKIALCTLTVPMRFMTT